MANAEGRISRTDGAAVQIPTASAHTTPVETEQAKKNTRPATGNADSPARSIAAVASRESHGSTCSTSHPCSPGASASTRWAPAAALADEGKTLADGTYTGTGTGMGGDINVTVEVKDGSISVVEIGPNNETVGIGGYEAIEDGTYASQIEAAQGAAIEGVSGATITSKAISSAVEDALAQAAGQTSGAENVDPSSIVLTADIYENGPTVHDEARGRPAFCHR